MWNAYGPSGARRALCVTVGWVALSASIVGFRVRSERGWCRAPSWVIIPDSCSSSSPSSRTSSSGGLRLYYYIVISQIATGRELLLAGLRVVRRRARGTRASRYFPRGGAPRGEWRPSSEGSLRAWRPGAKSGGFAGRGGQVQIGGQVRRPAGRGGQIVKAAFAPACGGRARDDFSERGGW